MNEQVKCGSSHTRGLFSALRRKEILTPAATWVNLEDIMCSEISPTEKYKHSMIPLTRVPEGVTFTEVGSKVVAARGWERKEGGVTVQWV